VPLAPVSAAVAAAGLLLHPSPAVATHAASSSCGKHGLVCMTVTVPLDRSRAVPGTIGLHVEVLPNTDGPRRGVIFLVAGGPGQGSARAFELGNPTTATFFRTIFPGWTLVAYDDRGTGSSGLLDCPAVDRADPSAVLSASVVAGCADSLGPARDFYGTADQADDMDAVRQALAVDKIAIYAVSYGTKLALAYASAYPDHVERLLLDSVVPLDRPDPFTTDELQALPATLANYCRTAGCRAVAPDFSGDVVALANSLAAAPLHGSVPSGRGHAAIRLTAAGFLQLVFDADLEPGLAAELPAAVEAARRGDPQPLLRLDEIDDQGGPVSSPAAISPALYLATTCHDGPFPWQPDTPAADRPGVLQAALAAGPTSLLGPFGPWALTLGTASSCLGWPTPTAGAAVAANPLPDVPVLALSGSLDLRTPTSWAASVITQFPQGHLLVAGGVGHSVLTMDTSGCSQRAVLHWMFGATPPTSCPTATPLVTTVPAFPTHLPARLTTPRRVTLAEQTLHDAEAIWLLALGTGDTSLMAHGLAGGTLTAYPHSIALSRYAITPGLRLTGSLDLTRTGPPVGFTGYVVATGGGVGYELLELKDGRVIRHVHVPVPVRG